MSRPTNQVKIGLTAPEIKKLERWSSSNGFTQPGRWATFVFRKELERADKAGEIPPDPEKSEDALKMAGAICAKLCRGEPITDGDRLVIANVFDIDSESLLPKTQNHADNYHR